jgi:hypothetical protein
VAAGLPSKVLILTTFDLDDYVYAGATRRLIRQFTAQPPEPPSSSRAA